MSFSKSKVTIVSIVLLFLLSTIAIFISQPVDAESQNRSKEVLNSDASQADEDEMAEELNYIYNNVIITDQNGQAKEVNLDKAEERYGYVPQQFKDAKAEVEKGQSMENNNTALRASLPKTAEQCYREKLEGFAGDLVPVATITQLVQNPNLDNAKAFSKAAIKAGIKGNVASMAAQIVYYNTQCAGQYPSEDQIS